MIQLDNYTKAYRRINISHSDENECECNTNTTSSISFKNQQFSCQNVSKINNNNQQQQSSINENQSIKQTNYRQLSFGELETIISQQTLETASAIAQTKIPIAACKSDLKHLEQSESAKQQLRRSKTTVIEDKKEPRKRSADPKVEVQLVV